MYTLRPATSADYTWLQELHHNRRGNIGSKSQGNNRKCLQGPTGEHIQQAEQLTKVLALVAPKKIDQIDLFLMGQRHNNMGKDAVDQQQPQGEENLVA